MLVDQKNFKSYFRDQLTFSKIRGKTSRQIYRLALPLLSPETLSSLSKLRIFLYNVRFCSICPKDDILQSLNSNGKYCHLVN